MAERRRWPWVRTCSCCEQVTMRRLAEVPATGWLTACPRCDATEGVDDVTFPPAEWAAGA